MKTAAKREKAADTSWEALVVTAAHGDDRALRDFYEASSWMVFGLALSILRDASEAEEVVLDVYLRVWKRARQFEPRRGSAKAWLTTITRSRAIDRVRRGANQAWRALGLEQAIDVAASSKTPEGEVSLHQECRRLRAAMAALADSQRQAIELAFLSGLTHSEVARTLGAPLGTVKSRIRLGLAKLRELLDDAAYGESAPVCAKS